MIYLAYCSSATRLFDSAELVQLLRQSRDSNLRQDLTGLLLYHDGSFIQVLEGDADVVQTLYRTICGDLRHKAVTRLTAAPLARRNFGEWSMAFVDTRDLLPEDREAYSDFLQQPLAPEQYEGPRALQLLHSFRRLVR